MKTTAIKIAAISVMSLGLTAGMFGGVSAQSWGGWKPLPQKGAQTEISVENETELKLMNRTSQNAMTGRVEIGSDDNDRKVDFRGSWHRHDRRDNGTVAGDVTTGAAMNENTTKVSVAVNNETEAALPEAPAAVVQSRHIHMPAPAQPADVEVEVENETEIAICNSTEQAAVSGSVTIDGARVVGDITTGDAENVNTSEFSLTVSSSSVVN